MGYLCNCLWNHGIEYNAGGFNYKVIKTFTRVISSGMVINLFFYFCCCLVLHLQKQTNILHKRAISKNVSLPHFINQMERREKNYEWWWNKEKLGKFCDRKPKYFTGQSLLVPEGLHNLDARLSSFWGWYIVVQQTTTVSLTGFPVLRTLYEPMYMHKRTKSQNCKFCIL